MSELSKHSARSLVFGLLFGIIFGFLLQKGGVGKFHVLIGQLLLEDWTVVKIMISAIIVGMIGIFPLYAAGKTELHVKPTKFGPNMIGGGIFGIGFALAAYCPGTNIAALGQGNWDALVVGAGLIVGSFLFAEMSAFLARTVETWGDRGKLTLADVTRIPPKYLVPTLAVGMIVLPWAIETFL